MMALVNVIAAVAHEGPVRGVRASSVVLGVLVLGLVLGAINGGLVVVTRVPDIVVTLAMSFVWAGCALLVLPTPGGGSAQWLIELVIGLARQRVDPEGRRRPPRRRRRRLDPAPALAASACRSTPSAATASAAFRSGVSVGRTRILAYMVTGLFAALAGLAVTASTGIGTPVPGPVHAR